MLSTPAAEPGQVCLDVKLNPRRRDSDLCKSWARMLTSSHLKTLRGLPRRRSYTLCEELYFAEGDTLPYLPHPMESIFV